jgi:hypothetical protein
MDSMLVIYAIPPNDPQQRPRATDVTRKQDGLAGSAACGGSTRSYSCFRATA